MQEPTVQVVGTNDTGLLTAYALMLQRVVEADNLDCCWEFTGARHTNGYGNVYVKRDGRGTCMTSHKLSYEVNVGPVPDGLVVRHVCDNRRCIRWDHLVPGTHRENMQDLRKRGRGRNQYGAFGHDHSSTDDCPF